MKKILFYTANGVGLGHLRRSCLITKEISSKNVKIILVTLASSPQIFGRFFDSLIQLTPLSDKLLNSPSKTQETRITNGRKFVKAIRKFRPNLIIADFYLASPFTFSAFQYALDRNSTQSIFIWRLGSKYRNYEDFKDQDNKFRYFEKVIIPHAFEEVKNLLPLSVFRKIEKDDKFSIVGPIFKKSNQIKLNSCRNKYKVSNNDFLITVSLGGGGKLEYGKCDGPEKIVNGFLDIYPDLFKAISNLRVIINIGPYFSDFKNRSTSRLKFVRFEEDLLELLTLSNLVISTAAYNICNELIEAKIPSILFPLMRGSREQFERAHYLEKKGIAKVFENGSSVELLKLILNVKDNLNKMKLNFRKFSDWQQGNNKAVKEILNILE